MSRRLIAVLAATGIGHWACGQGCDPTDLFAEQVRYPVGDDPWGVALADLDGDGDLDMAIENWGSLNTSVLLNNGDGTFGAQTLYAGPSAYGLALGDLDGDGDVDLVVAASGASGIGVRLNNGDGTFASATYYQSCDHPQSVALADLDGDGDLDAAVADFSADEAPVLLNNGDGTFAAATHYAAGDHPYYVAVGDLDGDGDTDMAVANSYYFIDDGDGDVSVLLNNGDGTFAAQVQYAAGSHAQCVALGDLDGMETPTWLLRI